MEGRQFHAVVPRRKQPLEFDTFRGLLDKVAADRPHVPVFSTLDYQTGIARFVMPKDLQLQIEGLGTWLYETGKHGKVIGLLGSNSYEWLLTFYSARYAGCVVLLLDRTADLDNLKDQIVRSGCQDLIYSQDVREKAEALSAETGASLTPFEALEGLVVKGRVLISEGKTACLDLVQSGEETAVIMFTSGTTGISKGVMLSSRNLLYNADCTSDSVNFAKDQVHFLPLNHIYALLAHFEALINGKRLHICLNMRRMAADFQEAKPELLCLVPLLVKNLYGLLWQAIRKHGDEEKVQKMILENREKGDVTPAEKRKMFAPYLALFGGRLETIISGGAPLDVQLIGGFADFGITVQEGYGITECSPVLAVNPDELNKPGTVGLALPGHEILIENPNEEGIGEICAKGPSVMQGYYHMEKETAEAMAGGWFHTGDLGFLDEDNYLTITGRLKNLIILSNGENVSPEELEAKFRTCEAINEVVVYEKDGRITAMIYPDSEFLALKGITDGEEYIRNFIGEYNKNAAATRQIGAVFFRDVPFEKTGSKKIKRTFEKL